MSEFEKMITTHKSMIESDYANICDYLQRQAADHDNDKVEPGPVNDVYQEHFPTLKTIEFGTPEYRQYELDYFKEAHAVHAQNRHHYYNPLNQANDINMFDLLEALVDIRQSQRQYSEYDIETIMTTLKNKGVLELDIEQLAYNTLQKLEAIDE